VHQLSNARVSRERHGGGGFCGDHEEVCSYFPFSGSTLKRLGPLVSRYEQTKSSLHFSPEVPLPLTLVRKLIKTRIAETKK
jgi:hypothetical protein